MKPNCPDSWEQLAENGRYSVRKMAKIHGVSVRTLVRQFRSTFGIAPHDWFELVRHHRAITMLSQSDGPIKEIAEILGYSSDSTFCRAFKKQHGMSPVVFQKQFLNTRNISASVAQDLLPLNSSDRQN